MDAPITLYIAALDKELATGLSSEHSFRTALKNLLESFDGVTNAQNETRKNVSGKPDLTVFGKEDAIIGYVETKDVGLSLDKEENTEQMKRYRSGLANLILTDYLEFRWYSRGELQRTARLGTLVQTSSAGSRHRTHVQPNTFGADEVQNLLETFLASIQQPVADSLVLAQRLAGVARLIRENIRLALMDDVQNTLHDQINSFRDMLLPELNNDEFADMYAQTICYGAFAARCNAPQNARFTRRDILYDLPKTNPFLRKMFEYVAGVDIDESVIWAVEDLATLLNRADMHTILQDFGKRNPFHNPVIHFYETFLAAYDNHLRKTRGVYYTPQPAVSYIVRSVDELLKSHFGLKKGLADNSTITFTNPTTKQPETSHKVRILDPAAGTGAFVRVVLDVLYEGFAANQGAWSGYVHKHVLPRFAAFELLVAPYAVAHLNLSLQLSQTNCNLTSDERLPIYLTNALSEPLASGSRLAFARWLTDEAEAANVAKRDVPVMVILGNPPYAVNSANAPKSPDDSFTQMQQDIRDAYYPDGTDGMSKEANPKVMLDDYVKFIRFAQKRIAATGYGVVGFITNHGYLDNPTFRRMRRSLMETFDDIYVLDLHGNSKKKETAPDGSPDENVFDIQQGVAIALFVKTGETDDTAPTARLHHAHLYGKRTVAEMDDDKETDISGGKYHWLAANTMQSTEWKRLQPSAPFYLFVPQDAANREEYEQGWKVNEIFPLHSTGVKTHRDHFVFDFDAAELRRRIKDFRNPDIEDSVIAHRYGLITSGEWNMSEKRKKLENDKDWEQVFTRCLYRPFDYRAYYHHEEIVERSRQQVMKHIDRKENLVLGVGRQGLAVNDAEWALVLCSRVIVDTNVFRRGGIEVFPLYRYNTANEGELAFGTEEREANIAPAFLQALAERLGRTASPEEVFYWIYAVLHSPTYRARYAEFLRSDFPRIPFPADAAVFEAVCSVGAELVQTHLLEREIATPVRFPQSGSNMVSKVEYKPQEECVYINATQWFEGVPKTVWEMRIGGYQVCEKWLKDRKGRTLGYDDIEHYGRVVAALDETRRLMLSVDEYWVNHL